MKTTLELPDHLMRRIKIRAAERNQKLKDVIEQLLELGIANVPSHAITQRAPKPVRLKKHGPLTISDIETAISTGRE